jgi:hypothetical protein
MAKRGGLLFDKQKELTKLEIQLVKDRKIKINA